MLPTSYITDTVKLELDNLSNNGNVHKLLETYPISNIFNMIGSTVASAVEAAIINQLKAQLPDIIMEQTKLVIMSKINSYRYLESVATTPFTPLIVTQTIPSNENITFNTTELIVSNVEIQQEEIQEDIPIILPLSRQLSYNLNYSHDIFLKQTDYSQLRTISKNIQNSVVSAISRCVNDSACGVKLFFIRNKAGSGGFTVEVATAGSIKKMLAFSMNILKDGIRYGDINVKVTFGIIKKKNDNCIKYTDVKKWSGKITNFTEKVLVKIALPFLLK